MCGRARTRLQRSDVATATGVPPEHWINADSYHPLENASPGCFMVTVHQARKDVGATQVHVARWGLIPSFNKPDAKPDFFRMFNARSESVTEKPAFRRLVPCKRCIVLVDGFFEWHKEKDGKQPYYIHSTSNPVLRMAGLYDEWDGSQGRMESFTILTTDSAPRLKWLHDRQPVMLMTQEAQDAWLQAGPISNTDLEKLSKPYNGEDLVWHPVTRAMNIATYQGDDCAKEVKPSTSPITAFFKPRVKANQMPKREAAEDAEAQPDAKKMKNSV